MIYRFKGMLKYFLVVILFTFWNDAFAEYERPQKIKRQTQTQLLIKETSDAKFVLENLASFQHIEEAKLDGDADIALSCKALSLIDAIQELELIKFAGILSDEDIQNIEWIPNLYIYIPENREEAFLLNPAWQYIRNTVIEFEEIPVDFEFFKGWKSIKYLCILGDFTSDQAEQATQAINKYIPKIEEVGLSLLDIKNMPEALISLNNLKSIEIYNSIDIAQGHVWEELGEIVRPLFKGFDTIFLDPKQRSTFFTKPKFIPLHYFAFEPEITVSQEKFIEALFPTKSYTNEYLWYVTPDEQKSDFLVYRGSNLTEHRFTQSFSTSVLSNYAINDAVYTGKGDSNCIFFTPNLGALIVPENSLEYSTGYPYSGKYTLHIATANKLEDLFAEGASLQFDSSGITYALNPEFWVHILINEAGTRNQLRIKPGNFLEFSYITEKKNKGGFYAWNKNSKKWENYYNYDYLFDDDKIRAIDFYKIARNEKLHVKQIPYESYSLDQRFELTGFQYLLNPGEQKVKIKKENGYWINKNTNKEDKGIQWVRGRPMFKLRLLPRGKQTSKFQDFKIVPLDRGLMPEWKELEDVVLSFETNLNKKEILKIISKKRWLDFRLIESQGFYSLELKTQNGFFEIQLSHPLERFKSTADRGEKANRKIRRAINDYFDERNMKALAISISEKQKTSLIERSQYASLFNRMHSNKEVVKSFKIRSLGEFAVGSLNPCKIDLRAEVILSDYGKVPLKLKRVWIYFIDGSSVELKVAPRIAFDYNVRDIAAILAQTNVNSEIQKENTESNHGMYYYLSGRDLLNQGIAPNKIMYLTLKPLPQNIKNNIELKDFMSWGSNKRQKRKRKTRNK